MFNIITDIAKDTNKLTELGVVYDDIPAANTDDTAAALGARIFLDTRLFGSSINDINKLTKKLCCEEDHGLATYTASKLTRVLGDSLDLGKLKYILYSILYSETAGSWGIEYLDSYTEELANSCDKVLFNKQHDIGLLACALLCLAGREEIERYNFAYDVLIPAISEQNFNASGVEKDVALALELLRQAENDLSTLYDDYDEITEEPSVYRALLIAALADLEGDDATALGGQFCDRTKVFSENDLLRPEELSGPEEDYGPLDDLDWDEFFVDEE